MMVDEISNKTLAVLLIVAIALSLGGTLVSLNRLSSVVRAPGITGYATSVQGTTNVTIQTVASLRFAIANINFGVGAVNTTAGNTHCSIASSQTGAGSKDSSSSCINFTATGGTALKSFQLENDGNLALRVNFTSAEDAAAYLGGTSPLFRYKVGDNETSACGTLGPTTWTNILTTNNVVCNGTGMDFDPAHNSIYMDINLTIPYDSNTGEQITTLTAVGTAI